jgi:hypothetical protein
MSMRISSGNVIRFTLDHSGWWARFRSKSNGEEWDERIIGWAVVVSWASWENPDSWAPGNESIDPIGDASLVETEIMAVVLSEGCFPITVQQYLRERPGVVQLMSLQDPVAAELAARKLHGNQEG